ncbi:battenin CLN3 protein [Savitreella phatthalungensis]
MLFAAFFSLGVLNNVIYVEILSAALDLVGPTTPKAVVLLFNICPAVLVKAVAPLVFQLISHNKRVAGVVVTNFVGMLLVGSTDALGVRLAGIAMASAASGAGEITFLQIASNYPAEALSAWSSGTGGAGILGGLLYTVCTTWLRFEPRHTLLACALLPCLMAVSYRYLLLRRCDDRNELTYTALEERPRTRTIGDFRETFREVILPLIIPYMTPLFLVYFAEYTINQGVAPTLVFPIEQTPFERYRDIYPTYATIYQVGVFISRSSSSLIRVPELYMPALAQCLLLIICIAQSLLVIVDSIYPVFLLILIEGLLGGLVYVNAMHNCVEDNRIKRADVELAIGSIGVADSAGIMTAGLLSLWLEPTLCKYAVDRGRPYCGMS